MKSSENITSDPVSTLLFNGILSPICIPIEMRSAVAPVMIPGFPTIYFSYRDVG